MHGVRGYLPRRARICARGYGGRGALMQLFGRNGINDKAEGGEEKWRRRRGSEEEHNNKWRAVSKMPWSIYNCCTRIRIRFEGLCIMGPFTWIAYCLNPRAQRNHISFVAARKYLLLASALSSAVPEFTCGQSTGLELKAELWNCVLVPASLGLVDSKRYNCHIRIHLRIPIPI